jgi:hypothetical protein
MPRRTLATAEKMHRVFFVVLIVMILSGAVFSLFRSNYIFDIYVSTNADRQQERFLNDLERVLGSRGYRLSQYLAPRSDGMKYHVVDANSVFINVFVQNVPLSGYKNVKTCQLRSVVDRGKFIVSISTRHNFPLFDWQAERERTYLKEFLLHEGYKLSDYVTPCSDRSIGVH